MGLRHWKGSKMMTEYIVALVSLSGRGFQYVHVRARGRANAAMGILLDTSFNDCVIVGIEEE